MKLILLSILVTASIPASARTYLMMCSLDDCGMGPVEWKQVEGLNRDANLQRCQQHQINTPYGHKLKFFLTVENGNYGGIYLKHLNAYTHWNPECDNVTRQCQQQQQILVQEPEPVRPTPECDNVTRQCQQQQQIAVQQPEPPRTRQEPVVTSQQRYDFRTSLRFNNLAELHEAVQKEYCYGSWVTEMIEIP